MVTVRIYRYDPAVDAAPRYETYQVPRQPLMRVLDVLDYVSRDLGVDIGYRWYCGTKKCGLCAVQVNGVPKLTCWEPAEPEMTLEPLQNLPVIRDLVVDRQPYDHKVFTLQPLVQRQEPYPGFPEPLTHAQMAAAERLRDCIQCLACYSACPVMAQANTGFAGPAALVQLAELALDPRDSAARGALAGREAQVFKCTSCYACEEVCPSHIPIVSKAIEPLKRAAYQAGAGAGVKHARVFLDLVRQRGRVDAPALVMKTRGAGSALRSAGVGLRMIARGKVKILNTLLGEQAPGTDRLRRLLDAALQQKNGRGPAKGADA